MAKKRKPESRQCPSCGRVLVARPCKERGFWSWPTHNVVQSALSIRNRCTNSRGLTFSVREVLHG